jgi:hypothetical protein
VFANMRVFDMCVCWYVTMFLCAHPPIQLAFLLGCEIPIIVQAYRKQYPDTQVCACVNVSGCLRVRVCARVYMCLFLFRVYVYVRARMCLSLCKCVCVCVRACVRVFLWP